MRRAEHRLDGREERALERPQPVHRDGVQHVGQPDMEAAERDDYRVGPNRHLATDGMAHDGGHATSATSALPKHIATSGACIAMRRELGIGAREQALLIEPGQERQSREAEAREERTSAFVRECGTYDPGGGDRVHLQCKTEWTSDPVASRAY